MDPEQTFIRVQERFSEMLTPKIRVTLEYLYLLIAIILFCILVVMHANYVQQPGCSSELSDIDLSEVQLIQIKISSVGSWTWNESEYDDINVDQNREGNGNFEVTKSDGDGRITLSAKIWLEWLSSGAIVDKSPVKYWKKYNEYLESQTEGSTIGEVPLLPSHDDLPKNKKDGSRSRFSPKESLKAAVIHLGRKWYGRVSFIWGISKRILGGLWDIAGIHLNLDVPKWLKILHLDKLNFYAVQWLGTRSKNFEPTYLYTMEKGYFLLPEEARLTHNIRTVNVSISAWHPCFGNRWQQLLINRLVGYDTILINSLLDSPGRDYLVTKCGVFMMSLFVFFTTTMSVSFTLRETQTRMLKFTVQLQHHARHRLPTFQLIFVHVIEFLVFVPIMIGILFFLFEFYDDQLLAFLVLILVWLCELFTLISVRTPISMKFFPRFFLLYFWFLLSSTLYNGGVYANILSFTFGIGLRLNTRNTGTLNPETASGPGLHPGVGVAETGNDAAGFTGFQERGDTGNPSRLGNPIQLDLRQPDGGGNPGSMNSFSSLLLWILGGASSEGLNSILSIFRDVRDHGHVFAGSAQQENQAPQNAE